MPEVNHYISLKQSNGKPVSIFRLDKKVASSESVEAGQRGFQRIRTLRHPYILPYVDGAEMDMELVLVTEHVVPLRSYLQKKYSSAEVVDDDTPSFLNCSLRYL